MDTLLDMACIPYSQKDCVWSPLRSPSPIGSDAAELEIARAKSLTEYHGML